MSTGAIVDNGGLVKSVWFPRAILPTATVLFNLAQYVLSVLVILPLMLLWYRIPLALPMLLFPVFVGLQLVFTIGVALILATGAAFLRDVRHLVEIAIAILFWMTPIVYDVQKVSDPLRRLILLTPMSPYVASYQEIFYYQRWPDLCDLGDGDRLCRPRARDRPVGDRAARGSFRGAGLTVPAVIEARDALEALLPQSQSSRRTEGQGAEPVRSLARPPGRRVLGAQVCLAEDPGGRVGRAGRPERVRQEHDAQALRGDSPADQRSAARRARRADWQHDRARHGVPSRADRPGERHAERVDPRPLAEPRRCASTTRSSRTPGCGTSWTSR